MKSRPASHTVLFAMLVATFATLTMPVHATDFSGYVEAPEGTWGWATAARPLISVSIEGGTAERRIYKQLLGSNSEFPLTEAILLLKITEVHYYDEAGVLQVTTDPVEIEQMVHLENSDEIWQDSYVIWVGTIHPFTHFGHFKMITTNWRVASNVGWWTRETSLWHLP